MHFSPNKLQQQDKYNLQFLRLYLFTIVIFKKIKPYLRYFYKVEFFFYCINISFTIHSFKNILVAFFILLYNVLIYQLVKLRIKNMLYEMR
jgi:hypothetical protein